MNYTDSRPKTLGLKLILLAGFLILVISAHQEAHGQTLTTLYQFSGGTDGSTPYGGLVRDSKGNLYGTTIQGGAHAGGTVFEITALGTEKVLYSFCSLPTGSICTDGTTPYSTLLRDTKGNLFGTTDYGGAYDAGTIFQVGRTGKETVLYSFTGGADGANPTGGLIRDASGNLYGTTYYGGTPGCKDPHGSGCGTVFELTATGTLTVLYSFSGGSDGASPGAGLTMDKQGNLFGTTVHGGYLADPICGLTGCGTVFELSPSGSTWVEKVVYAFALYPDGGYPYGSPVLAGKNIWVTTSWRGFDWSGAVIELTSAGKEKTVYNFQGGTDGWWPYAGLVRDSKGNLYGTTPWGGQAGCGLDHCGTIFMVTASGSEKVLYRFSGGVDGSFPIGGLIMDKHGNLYGTTAFGNTSSGTVFMLTP